MVYVDNARIQFGRMKMCHLIADSTEELLEFVDKINVQRKWIQKRGTYKEHFDICLSKRKLAIESGAIPVTKRKFVSLIQKRRMKNAVHK